MSAPNPPFHLVLDGLSHDVIECLAQLLHDAESGELLGFACAAMYKGRRYIVDVAGECYRSPTFTRGLVAVLDDELSNLVRGR